MYIYDYVYIYILYTYKWFLAIGCWKIVRKFPVKTSPKKMVTGRMCHVQNFVSVTDVRNYTGDRLNFTLAAQKVDTLGPDVRIMAEA